MLFNKGFIKKVGLIMIGSLSALSANAQVNDECDEMEPICTDAGLSFTAQTGVTIGPDPNDYGCLFSQPNPTWYYFEIATDGNIDMNLFAPSDIDFIIWGPFDDLAEAQSYCGQMGVNPNAPEVDCSYSGTNNEFPSIPSAVTGDVYVMLITNYASIVQDVTLTQVGGTGSTDCTIITPDPCVSDPGTYTVEKNGVLTTSSSVYLCEDDEFELISDGNYILPNDTIPNPPGDGIYSATLMWLVYDAMPIDPDPDMDPGFQNIIIPGATISDVNNSTSPIVQALGCGTYYFVPVAGDDGVGGNGGVANLTNDNGGLDWDKNGNDCYLLGDPVEITYACEMNTATALDCNPPTTINGIDVQITGGAPGSYSVVNTGEGNLTSTTVPHDGTANINDLENNQGWSILITDSEGCTQTASGVFAAPVFQNITITPAPTCPSASTGSVNVTINGTSGNGGPYTIIMAGDPPTVGTTDSYADNAGTLVYIVVADDEGCISDSSVTITSAGHFIDVDVISLTGEDCYDDGNGSAQITADPSTPGVDVTEITWTGPSGQTPGGNPGGPANTGQTGMEPGNWSVTIADDLGCEVTIPIVITSPAELDLYVSNSNEPTCYGYSDGSITVQSTGGSGGLTYTWNPTNAVPGNTFNNLDAGIYWAYVTDQNGCIDSVMFDLGQPDSLWAEFTIKNIDCYGDSTGAIIVDAVNNAVGSVSYFWNLSGAAPNPPSTSNVANGLPVGTYVINIQDAFCYNEYYFTLTQSPEIVMVQFGSEPAFCRTASYQSGNGVVYGAASGGVPDYEYEWVNLENGDNSNNTTWGGLNPGTYQLTVTDDLGCTLVQTIELDSVNPIAAFDVISAELDGNLEGTAVVCASFDNNSEYFANPNDPNADTTFFWQLGYDVPWEISHDVNEVFDTCYYEEGIFEVCLVALNKNGCSDTACVNIIVHDYPILVAPNVFTPGGGDDANPVFTFEERQTAIETFECTVFDRWGKEMFHFDSIDDFWDGNTKNGKEATDGVYFYIYSATATNGTTFEGQGNVHLIRK